MEKDIKLFKYYKSGIMQAPKGSGRKSKEVELYKLDIQPPKDAWKGYRLPPQYLKILNDAVFVLPGKAKSTIEYLLAEAPVQRYMPLYFGYDTSVRETLMEIGAKFFEKAVYLLCDYYYDEETQYCCRHNKEVSSNTLKKLIIYHYWNGRTGRGLPFSNAGFHLDKYSNDNLVWGPTESYYVAQQIRHHEAEQEAKWASESKQLSLFGDCDEESCEGSCIGDKIYYNKFDVKIEFNETEYGSNGKVERVSDGNMRYLIVVVNKQDAKTVALNQFYKTFDDGGGKYDINPVNINSINIKQVSEEKFEKKQVSLLNKHGRPIWVFEM